MPTATKAKRTKASAPPATKKPAKKKLDVTFTLTGVDAATFLRAVRAAAIAASRDDCRPVLTGMHFATAADGALRIECTDSYRLYRIDMRWPGDALPEHLDVTVPAAFLDRHLPRRPPAGDLGVTIRLTDAECTIRHEGCTYTTPTCAGQPGYPFPNTQQILDACPQTDAGMVGDGPRAFNPTLLGDVFRAARRISASAALRVTHLEPMKPCRFDVVAGDLAAVMILMPVRL